MSLRLLFSIFYLLLSFSLSALFGFEVKNTLYVLSQSVDSPYMDSHVLPVILTCSILRPFHFYFFWWEWNETTSKMLYRFSTPHLFDVSSMRRIFWRSRISTRMEAACPCGQIGHRTILGCAHLLGVSLNTKVISSIIENYLPYRCQI